MPAVLVPGATVTQNSPFLDEAGHSVPHDYTRKPTTVNFDTGQEAY